MLLNVPPTASAAALLTEQHGVSRLALVLALLTIEYRLTISRWFLDSAADRQRSGAK